MAPHSSTVAWKIPWTEEPGRLQSTGPPRVGHDLWLHLHFSLSCIGEGNGNPLQCSCLENPRDGSLVGCRLWGRTVGHDWCDLAAAAGIEDLLLWCCNCVRTNISLSCKLQRSYKGLKAAVHTCSWGKFWTKDAKTKKPNGHFWRGWSKNRVSGAKGYTAHGLYTQFHQMGGQNI